LDLRKIVSPRALYSGGLGLAARSVKKILRGYARSMFPRTELADTSLPEVHFFTLVLNGMPFIKHHLETFRRLTFPWKWHIIEGMADLQKDTAWSLEHGGKITNELHSNGLSNDGTSEYINELTKISSDNIRVYRKPSGQFWSGKVEMCNAPLNHIDKPCILWQIDVDEFWTAPQIERLVGMFQRQTTKTAAWFYCKYFIGPSIVIATRDNYGNNPSFEWLRVWRFRPGMTWASHEPPRLMFKTWFGSFDVGRLDPFSHDETEGQGLVFNHYGYVVPEQLRFKEIYYGYHDALQRWKRLQSHKIFPVYLREFFPWVKDDTLAKRVEKDEVLQKILEKQ